MFRILTDEGLRKDLSNKGKRHAYSFMWKTTAKRHWIYTTVSHEDFKIFIDGLSSQ